MIAIDPVLQIALRVAPALVLLAAAAHKAGDVRRFRDTVAAYDLAPRGWADALGLARGDGLGSALVALASIALEGAIGALLLAGLVAPGLEPLGRSAACAGALLLSAYALAIGVNLRRGRTIDCGCGGPMLRERRIGADLLVRNLLLAVALVASTLPASARSLGWLDVTTAALFALASVLVLAAAETALDNAARLPARRAATGRSA